MNEQLDQELPPPPKESGIISGLRYWDIHGLREHARATLAQRANQPVQLFQQRVQPWMMACFGAEISADRSERNHRFLEESLELVQACGCTAGEAHQLVDYVFGRDIGEPAQEVGGVMVTLAALCLANNLDMHANGETELALIWTKVEAIHAKQAAKPKHSPLPATPAPATPAASVDTPDVWTLALDMGALVPNSPRQGDGRKRYWLVEDAIAHTARAVADAYAKGRANGARDEAIQQKHEREEAAPQQQAQAALSDEQIRALASTSGLLEENEAEWSFTDAGLIAFAKNVAASHQPAAAPAFCNDGSEPDWAAYAAAEVQQGGELPQDDLAQRLAAIQRGLHPNFHAVLAEAVEAIAQRAASVPAQAVQPVVAQEPEKFDTEQSREYLVGFMEQHFTDTTYHRYIRAERTGNNLAGDFAWQMARALRIVQAAPVPAASVPDAGREVFPQHPDSEYLDFLDRNLRFNMGWRVGKAPAGNLSIQSVINLKTSIRDAIRALLVIDAAPQTTEKP